MSSALINDYPITFLPHLAKAIGVNEALVLQQLHYWLVNHAEVQHEGKFWIYKTYEEWQEQDFFFWSVRTVKSVFKNLTNLGLIESEKLSSNRHNRVNYYTINAEKLAEISAICEAEFEQKRLLKLAKKGVKVCTFDSAEVAQSDDANFAQSQSAEVAQCLREQEENNKDNNEDINKKSKKTRLIDFPSDFTPNNNQVEKCKTYNLDVVALVDSFRNYHEAKGSKFASWSAAFNTWINNEIKFNNLQPIEQSSYSEVTVATAVKEEHKEVDTRTLEEIIKTNRERARKELAK